MLSDVLRLEPRLVPLIWGGDTLARRFGKPADPTQPIGESWECWEGDLVRSGPCAGQTLAQARATLGAALMGRLDAAAPFPVLTKFIDARQALSVQVHPDDDYAQRVEHQPNGKTECWYILEAAPGAELILGWSRAMTREEYRRRVADGTLGDVLRRVPVAPGQVYFLPAGTLHAIGAGIVLFEVQQTSDLTYRIFDWNRVGTDGKPRELHVDKAADVLDYRACERGAIAPLVARTSNGERTWLVVDRRFSLERFDVRDGIAALEDEDAPLIVQALERPCTLEIAGASTELAPYACAVVPAAARVGVRGATTALVARPLPQRERMVERARQSGAAPAQIDAFLAAFDA